MVSRYRDRKIAYCGPPGQLETPTCSAAKKTGQSEKYLTFRCENFLGALLILPIIFLYILEISVVLKIEFAVLSERLKSGA